MMKYKNLLFICILFLAISSISVSSIIYVGKDYESRYVNTGSDTMTGNLTASWFLGSFNWTTTDDWSSFDGQIFDFNESKLSTTYYNATESEILNGSIDGGNLSVTQHPDGNYDGISFNFSEASGSPGLDLRMNFTNVTGFNRGVIRYKTSSLAGDYPIIQLWSYTDSAWEDYPAFAESDSFATITQPVFDDTEHLSNGVVSMRLYKSSNGNTNNHYYVDWVSISKGFGTPSGEEIDPLSIHRDGNISLTGNWDAGSYNITSSWIIASINASNIKNDYWLTSNQTISFSGDNISISGGNEIDISGIDTTIGNCSGETCSVTNTGTLDGYEASALLDNTNQTLSWSGTNISISDGNEIDIASVDTTIGNCSGQTCAVTNTGTLDGLEGGVLHQFGDCPAGQFVQNTTASTVECGAPSGSGDITGVYTTGKWLYNGSSSGEVALRFNESELGVVIDAYGFFDSEINLTNLLDDNYVANATTFSGTGLVLGGVTIASWTDVNGSADDTFVTANNITGWGFYNAEINLTTLLDDNYLVNSSSATFSKVTGTNVCVGAICISNWDEVNKTFTDTNLNDTVAGGDLSGTYPSPSVIDDSHEHTKSTITISGENITVGTVAEARIHSTIARDAELPIGDCSSGNFIQNTTSGAVECATPTDTNTGNCSVAASCSNIMYNLIEDTSPQLGGYLDAAGQTIGSTADEIENAYVGDNNYVYYGNDQDCKIGFNTTLAALVIDCT